MQSWDTELYAKYLRQRTQPAIDLLSRVTIDSPECVVDAGCGPGNSTLVLQQRWPGANILAFDSSPEMLAKAKQQSPGVDWFLADLNTWHPRQAVDLIFANAVLHWAPNHRRLLPRLLSALTPHGCLALQMPAHYRSLIHELLESVADRPAWRKFTQGARSGILRKTATDYYDLLSPLATELDVWETVYFHSMENASAVMDWFRATGLRPVLGALPNDEARVEFEAELLSLFEGEFRQRSDGKILLPFPRLFIVARN